MHGLWCLGLCCGVMVCVYLYVHASQTPGLYACPRCLSCVVCVLVPGAWVSCVYEPDAWTVCVLDTWVPCVRVRAVRVHPECLGGGGCSGRLGPVGSVPTAASSLRRRSARGARMLRACVAGTCVPLRVALG